MESNKVNHEAAQKLRDLCVNFFGTNWTKGEISIKRIVAGVSNQIYQCTLNNETPESVVVRFNGNEFVNSIAKKALAGDVLYKSEATMAIISQAVADAGLSPKILGVFEGGRIDQFIEGRNLIVSDFSDHSLYAVVAQMMAKFHLLNVPIRRRPLITDESLPFDPLPEPDYSKFDENEVNSVKHLFSFPSIEEGMWTVKMAHKLNSRIVFSHNDLHLNNIMLKYKFDESRNRLVFIDFDLSGYNYRGYDFAFFMNSVHEFQLSNENDCVNVTYTGQECPEDIKRLMIEKYLNQWKEDSGVSDAAMDTYDQIVKEIDFFRLLHYLVLLTFAKFLSLSTHRTTKYSHIAALISRYWKQKKYFTDKYAM